MANRDAPFGFRPAMHLTGGTIRKQEYSIASALGTGIGMGDTVMLNGLNDKNIVVGTAGGIKVGVFAGCSFQDTDGNMIYRRDWPASQATLGSVDAVAYVYDDPFIIFKCQGDGTGAATNIGDQADLVATAFDTVSGQSRQELDTSDIATGANLYVFDWVHDPDLVKTGANPNYLVLINEHEYRSAGAASFVRQT
jgi:hypothetical protein